MQLTHPPKTPLIFPPRAGPSNASDSQEPLGDLREAPTIHSFHLLPQSPVCSRVSIATIRL